MIPLKSPRWKQRKALLNVMLILNLCKRLRSIAYLQLLNRNHKTPNLCPPNRIIIFFFMTIINYFRTAKSILIIKRITPDHRAFSQVTMTNWPFHQEQNLNQAPLGRWTHCPLKDHFSPCTFFCHLSFCSLCLLTIRSSFSYLTAEICSTPFFSSHSFLKPLYSSFFLIIQSNLQLLGSHIQIRLGAV